MYYTLFICSTLVTDNISMYGHNILYIWVHCMSQHLFETRNDYSIPHKEQHLYIYKLFI